MSELLELIKWADAQRRFIEATQPAKSRKKEVKLLMLDLFKRKVEGMIKEAECTESQDSED
jgi:hypothetical protein